MAPWITVLSGDTVFTKKVIYKFTFVWYYMKQGTTYSTMSHLAHLYTVPFSLAMRRKQMAAQGWWFRWPAFVMAVLKSHIFCILTVFQPIWGRASAPDSEPVSAYRISLIASSSSLIFSWPMLRLLQQSALFKLLCMTEHSCSNLMSLWYGCFLH